MKSNTKKSKGTKRIIVTAGTRGLNPAEAIHHSRGVNKTCDGSMTFQGSPACKEAMTNWMKKTDELEVNQLAIKAKQDELAVLLDNELICLAACNNAANEFAAAVQTRASDNPTVVTEMGMTYRADPTYEELTQVPSGVCIAILKTTGLPRLEWDPVPGAAMYTAQMSVAPATDSSWTGLYGHGCSRPLPPLEPGQQYLFRVCAVGTDTRPTDWSQPIPFTAK